MHLRLKSLFPAVLMLFVFCCTSATDVSTPLRRQERSIKFSEADLETNGENLAVRSGRRQDRSRKLSDEVKPVSDDGSSRQDRSRQFREGRMSGYRDMLSCGLSWNGACFLDAAEDVLLQKHASLLAEADRYALQQSSRQSSSEEINTPSELVDSISLIFLEIRDLFKGGLTGLFRDAKDDDLDDQEEEDEGALDDAAGEEEEEEEERVESSEEKLKSSRRLGVEERGKKKKKKLKAIIKLLVLGAVFFAKITLLLKVLAAHLQVKFLLIAFAGLILNAARFYFDLKKGHSPQKVIYYEHAQHQHHYDGGEEDWSSGGGGGGGGGHGGYWGRSYVMPDDVTSGGGKTAQDIAYAQQKPIGTQYARVEDKPNFSWD